MSSQTSKSALKQLEKTNYLVNSIRTQKPIVNARLARLTPGTPSDGTGDVPFVPDWNQLQDWDIRTLDESSEDIRQIDHTLRQVLVRSDQLRADRRDQVKTMSSDYRAVRRAFSGVFGKESLALTGLDAEPARGLLAIQEQVSELIIRMRDPELIATLPKPQAGQAVPDLDALTANWEAQSQRFDDLTQEIDRLYNHAQELRVLHHEALQRGQRLYVNIGRLQEGLYRLAGLDDLADRMRASRRATRNQQDEPGEASTSSSEALSVPQEPIDPLNPGAAGEAATAAASVDDQRPVAHVSVESVSLPEAVQQLDDVASVDLEAETVQRVL